MWLETKKGSDKWYAKFAHPDGSGRYISRSTGIVATRLNRGKALDRGDEIKTEIENELHSQRTGGDVLTGEVALEYWKTDLKELKWAPSAKKHLARIVDHLGQNSLYCNVRSSDVASFVDKLKESGQFSNYTINLNLSVWQRMHKVAATKREYPVRVLDWQSNRVMQPEGRKRFLEIDEVEGLRLLLPAHAWEIVLFAVFSGCRKMQILTLDWSRVSIDRETVTVIKKHRKQNVEHVVELSPVAMSILHHRLAVTGGTGPVFDTTNFRKLFEAAIREAGIEDFRFHDLRHTAATWLARVAPLQIVKEQLGHTDIKTTMRYSHVQQKDIKDAVQKMPMIGMDLAVVGDKTDALRKNTRNSASKIPEDIDFIEVLKKT
jgi:integrase